jgi:putative transposase
MQVTRAERHIIIDSQRLDDLCFKSKNLYNKANYVVRQKFIETSKEVEEGKRKHAEWVRYNDLDRIAKQENWSEYKELPAQTAQQILKLLEKNWKSFFAAIKVWNTNPEKFNGRPKLPRYKHKTNGRNITIFTNQQAKIKDGYIHFPEKVGLNPLKTVIDGRLNQVRIIPRYGFYVIEVIYEKDVDIYENLNNNIYLGIDLGLNNLAALTSNDANIPVKIIKGGPLKSINQFYNKKKAQLMSFIGDIGTSNWIEKLTRERNQKVDDYMHKSSRFIINYCLEYCIGNIVIGNNDDWKREINLGKRNNQNFVSIPFEKLIRQIQYKAEEVGIKVILSEESYTSKCSFFDNEQIQKHEEYMGKRVKRGLFRTFIGKLVNADVNGSLNIIRKVVPDAFADGIEGLGLNPMKVMPS